MGKFGQEIESGLNKTVNSIIMNNEALKVNCRKVTNDSKVTTRSYSWETKQRLVWWRKMEQKHDVIFRILNYAEKKAA
ncbi:hypothetical protein KHA80_21620 [Anaerobacillus sp. HL2]|nr:hypothetical protein KHA80_21620 [Anaerobacillus sp. HL2]